MAKKKRRALTKDRVARWLGRRFFLRAHMSLILIATFLAGLGATKLLLTIGVASMAVRYVLAVCAAYVAFLVLIRLWLFYVGVDRDVDLSADGIDYVDLRFSDAGEAVAPLQTGGGGFGGGGATGSWDAPATAPVTAPARAGSVPVKGSGGGFDLDLDGLIVVALFIALVGALLFVGLYIIYTAPALLSEAAFEALLAGALVRRAKKIDRPGWVGAVWKATLWPFLAIVILAGALGWAANKYCPEANTLRGAWECPSRLISSPPP